MSWRSLENANCSNWDKALISHFITHNETWRAFTLLVHIHACFTGSWIVSKGSAWIPVWYRTDQQTFFNIPMRSCTLTRKGWILFRVLGFSEGFWSRSREATGQDGTVWSPAPLETTELYLKRSLRQLWTVNGSWFDKKTILYPVRDLQEETLSIHL